jgi:hypothetical protein
MPPMRVCYRARPSVVVLSLLGMLPLATAPAAQQPPKPSAGDVHMIIEADRQMYRVTDTVKVRITLKNVSRSPVGWNPIHHENDVRLIVATEDGKVVKPVLSFGAAGFSWGQYVKLEPQESLTWPWFPLTDWGYALFFPSTYSIVGIPLVARYGVEPDRETVRSNQVTFTLVP